MKDVLHFNPPVIAHRGASGYAPENTMAAFRKAAELGIQWIEFDVMLSKDHSPIIFHDETLDRTTNARGSMLHADDERLKHLDAGGWFGAEFKEEKIPFLAEVLAFLSESGLSANVEIKPLPHQEKETVRMAFKEIHHKFTFPTHRLLLSSFSITALEEIRKQSNSCLLGLLMHEWLPDWSSICDQLHCISVHINQEIMTPQMAKKIKDSGRMLLCYTVNSLGRAQELYSWGVDAVFSDVPDQILI